MRSVFRGSMDSLKIERKNLIKKEKTTGFQPQIFSIKACLNEGSDIFASFVFSFGYTEMNQPLRRVGYILSL